MTTSGAQLDLSGGLTFGTESTITINGSGGANFAGSLQSASGTNVWSGNVIIGSSGSRLGARAGATLEISGIISGFIVRDHVDLQEAFVKKMSGWIRSGGIVWEETISEGIEMAPDAFIALFDGDKMGKAMVKV